MEEPPAGTALSNASRAEMLKTCKSPAVQIVGIEFNDVRDVAAQIAAGRTVSLKGMAATGVMVNSAVDGTMPSACADDFQYSDAEASPVCSLYSNFME
jgi:hypothetical protein